MEELTTDVGVNTNTKGMSAYSLKTIAIIAMVIDHIAWGFVPTCSFFWTNHALNR